jgi:hypothetical protein
VEILGGTGLGWLVVGVGGVGLSGNENIGRADGWQATCEEKRWRKMDVRMLGLQDLLRWFNVRFHRGWSYPYSISRPFSAVVFSYTSCDRTGELEGSGTVGHGSVLRRELWVDKIPIVYSPVFPGRVPLLD